MGTIGRSVLSRLVAVAAVVAVSITVPARPAIAAAPFTVVSAASYEGIDGSGGATPSGALLSIFTDRPVTGEATAFTPWTMRTPGGVWVETGCAAGRQPIVLPLLYVGPSGSGTQLNFYLPNPDGPEPYGTCDGAGSIWIAVHPGAGYGAVMLREGIRTVTAHPGIFSVGLAPAGSHVDGRSQLVTPIATCLSLLGVDPTVCPVSSGGRPAGLRLYLTGAERFLCDPCGSGPLAFELAPVVGDTVGGFVRQSLVRLVRDSLGVERAEVVVAGSMPAGTYRLRVTSTVSTASPVQLTVGFGRPAT